MKSISGTRGIRNNNAGNIDYHASNPWVGQIGIETDVPKPRFAVFKAPEYGIRAIAVLLKTYQNKHGCNTVAKIIGRYAPTRENNTSSYVAAVARSVGVAPHDVIDVHQYAVMKPLVKAIITHENGSNPYSDALIDKALRLAKIDTPKPLTQSKRVVGGTMAIAGGSTGAVVQVLMETLPQVQGAITPISEHLEWAKYACLALTIVGGALAVYSKVIEVRNKA